MRSLRIILLVLIFNPTWESHAQNLIAHYPFEGNANDASINSNDGIVSGASLTKDRLGNNASAYFFDGIDDYIDVGNDTSLALADGYSISVWFKSTGVNTYQTLVSKGYGSAGTYTLTLTNIGAYQFIRFFIEGEVVQGTIPINNEWNHVVLNMQTGENNVKVYLNGELYLSHTTNSSLSSTSAFNVRIGNNQRDESYFFKGAIDDVKLFNSALSIEEVKQLATPLAAKFGANKAGFGNAIRFDGIDDYVVLPTASAPDNGVDFTFETWVNWEGPDTPGKKETIWGFGQTNTDLLQLTIADGFPTFYVGSANNFVTLAGSQKLQVGKWQHLALSYESSTNIVRIYLEGAKIAEGVFSQVQGIGANTYHLLGLDYAFFNKDYFTGALDETRLWSETRTTEEIFNARLKTINQITPKLSFSFNYDKSIANGDNRATTILEDVFGQLNGNLSSFQLLGDVSNFISSEIGLGQLVINQVNKSFYLAGDELDILGKGFLPGQFSNKLQLGDELITINNASQTRIKAIIPSDFSEVGVTSVIVGNAFGSSVEKKISLLYPDDNYEFELREQQLAGNLFDSQTLAVADLDGDGDDDIITGLRQLYWIENLGDGLFSDKQLIIDNVFFWDLDIADLDSDGDIDILIGTSNGLADTLSWFENLGAGNFNTTKKLIYGRVGANNDFNYPFKVADIDGDGHNDVVAAEQSGGIAWYKNPGNHMNFIRQALNSTDLGIGVGVVDFDGDGDIDIVAGVNDALDYDGGTDLLYLNEGSGLFASPIIINENKDANIFQFSQKTNFGFADFNQDGKMDVLSVNVNYAALLLQVDQGFEIARKLNNYTQEVSVADGDGDGDQDFFVAHYGGNGFQYYENSGDGTFTEQFLGRPFFQGYGQADASDIDNDGDVDLVFSSGGDGVVRVYSHVNTGTDFLSFEVEPKIGEAIIDDQLNTVNITVPNNFPLNNTVPRFKTDFRSTATLAGTAQISADNVVNFANPVNYEIQSEAGASENWTVTLNPLPGIPQIIELDDITETAAELEWTATTYTDSYRIEVSDDGFDTFTVYETSRLDTIISLEPGTEYAVRMISVNAFGESEAYSEVEDFTTIPGQPVLNEVTDTTTSTAKIVWQENKGTDFYLLEIATDPSFNNYLPGFNPATIVGSNTNITVTNLEDGTNYYARLASRNNDNETGLISQLSTIVTFQTKFKVPFPPLAREASSVASTSFTANWDASPQGKEFTYIVEYSDDIAFEFSKVSDTLSQEQRSLSITDLNQYTSYWYRVYTENESGRSTPSNTIFVKKELTIRNLDFDSLRDAKSISKDTISFEVTGGLNNYQVGVRYRGILSTDWTSRAVDKQGGKYAFRILDSFLDEIGGEFELYVGDGTDTTSRKRNFIYWSDIENELPNLELAGKWQMFSIPYNFEDNLIETIFDEMGPYRYKKEWRLMQYDGSKYLDAGSGINRIELGESYWFYTLNKIAISLENGTVNTKTPFKMSLMPGWNQIGNPYNIPVSWNSVRAKNQVAETVGKAIGFNSSSQQFEDTDIIRPFEGAFVWSDEGETVDISLIDNKALRQIEEVELSGSDIDEDSWVQPLYLNSSAKPSEPIAAFGMHPEASTSKDNYDKMQLPRFVNYTEMYTTHQEYFYPRFSQDIQQTSEAHSWLYTLESNEKSGIHTISWKNEEFKNSKRQLWLIDEEKGVLVNMNTESEYSFNWQGTYQFSVHLTASLEDKPIPYLLSIGDPFPNPISEMVYIRLSLPEADKEYTIVVKLLNIQGELVMSRSIENIGSGFRELSLLTAATEPLTSGVYFFQIKVIGEKTYDVTRKVIFQQ